MSTLLFASIPRTDFAVAAVNEAAPPAEFPLVGDRTPHYTMTAIATAYSSDPWQTDATPCIPAMGSFNLCEQYEQHGLENTIAANFLPLGTRVRFPELFGEKEFVVRDRMNAKYNGTSRIDFWVGSETPKNQEIVLAAKQKAIAFGVKRVTMEVYGK